MQPRTMKRAVVFWPLMLLACGGGDLMYPPLLPPEQVLARITVSPSVTILAVGQTDQLTVSGRSLANTPITTFDSVQYAMNSLSDTLRARVSPTGLITALATSTSPILVNAIAFKSGSVKGYQVLLQVTASAQSGLTLSIQPVAPDSSRLAAGVTKTIVPVIRNPSTGASVSNPVMRYTSADSSRIVVFNPLMSLPPSLDWGSGTGTRYAAIPTATTASTNQIRALREGGPIWVYAAANVYGTLLRDSVQYTLTNPFTATINTTKVQLGIASTFANQSVTLAAGATVTFSNGIAAPDPLNIAYTFDNPAAATAATPPSTSGGASGDVTALAAGTTSRRRFMTAGTYRWTATASGGSAPWNGQTLRGTIVIK